MYCKLGCITDAFSLFNAMDPPSRHHPSTWHHMIGICARLGCPVNAHACFYRMLSEALIPGKNAFSSLLSLCVNRSHLPEGCRLHAQIWGSELKHDVAMGTSLIIMYRKCSNLDDAIQVFHHLPSPDVVSWTALINTYVLYGKNKLALGAFHLLQHGDIIVPSRVTFISILSACIRQDDLYEGKEIHRCIKKSGFDYDVVVCNALISMYGRCGSLEDARDVFDAMLERNVVSWNAMIGAYAKSGEGREALILGFRMHQHMLPDDVTLVSLLDVCASLYAFIDGKIVHCYTFDGKSKSNITLGNALVHMYGTCGHLDDANKVFDDMNTHNETSWNALISIFVTNGQDSKAIHLFGHMKQEGTLPNKITFVSVFSACAAGQQYLVSGKYLHSSAIACDFESDLVVGTALVNMYGKSLCVDNAMETFHRMPEHNIVCITAMISVFAQNGQANNAVALFHSINDKCDAILWNSVISSLAQSGQGKRALAMFEQMLLEGIMPDRVTFISNLDACANVAILGEAKRMHSRVVSSVFKSDDMIQNELVNMYGRCGSVEVAWNLFKQLLKRDVFSWSSIIAAYAQIGRGKDALNVFKQMKQEGVTPDKITFINVLSACSHAGLVREGCQQFASMKDDYGITPMIDHYNCMIDLLGRSGRLDEAEELILSMKVQATVVSWLTMLSACRNNLDVRRGEWAAESLFKLDPDNATPYIMLANIYTATGQSREAEDVLNRMGNKGLMPGNKELCTQQAWNKTSHRIM